jgi:hypothetical protein
MARTATNCPICRKPARRARAVTGDYIEITCGDCGQFQASETFRQTASRHPVATRRHALEKAKMRAGYGALPALTTYDLP